MKLLFAAVVAGCSSADSPVWRGGAKAVSGEDKLSASDRQDEDYYGMGVAGVGDVNGDGYGDLVVGAIGVDDDEGAVYLYLGSASGLQSAGEQKLLASDGDERAELGFGVSGAGDVNGDGYDDVVAGAYWNVHDGIGRAYLWYGSASGLRDEQRVLASDGEASEQFGRSVAGLGDVDGDGYDDVAVGAPWDDDAGARAGAVYVYYGSPTGLDTAREDKLADPVGYSSGSFGQAVAGAGDVDGDGFDDLVIGQPGYHSDRGRLTLVHGGSGGLDFSRVVSWTASDASSNAYLGQSVAGVGDIDADGFDDVVAGAYLENSGGTDAGAAYVYYGSASGITGAKETKLTASDADSWFGNRVSGGDLNADGFADVVVGAPGDDDLAWSGGSAYIYEGSSAGLDISSEQKVTASDWASGAWFGFAVAVLPDVDGDGVDDVAVGAHGMDVGGTVECGAVYVGYGSCGGLTTWYADADGDGHGEVGRTGERWPGTPGSGSCCPVPGTGVNGRVSPSYALPRGGANGGSVVCPGGIAVWRGGFVSAGMGRGGARRVEETKA